MTMEPVFAGIFGVFFGKNHLTVQIIFGAVCVLTAMLIVALKSSAKTTKLEN
jgi:drug/metabolite transporter (DMT)-like permease